MKRIYESSESKLQHPLQRGIHSLVVQHLNATRSCCYCFDLLKPLTVYILLPSAVLKCLMCPCRSVTFKIHSPTCAWCVMQSRPPLKQIFTFGSMQICSLRTASGSKSVTNPSTHACINSSAVDVRISLCCLYLRSKEKGTCEDKNYCHVCAPGYTCASPSTL